MDYIKVKNFKDIKESIQVHEAFGISEERFEAIATEADLIAQEESTHSMVIQRIWNSEKFSTEEKLVLVFSTGRIAGVNDSTRALMETLTEPRR